MGSVKDLIILREATEDGSGRARFLFSDRYSVFDWGEMPDQIKGKGASTCIATAYFFERLEELGVRTHYLGVVEDEKAVKMGELEGPSDTIEFRLLRVIRPRIRGGRYDYSVYERAKGNFLIPLEIIYRNALPEGSSVFRRLKEGRLKLDDIGLEEMPEPGEVLEKPIIEVSTKLEAHDRYLSWDEAMKMCCLSEDEADEMKRITSLINDIITQDTGKIGLFNEDGKIEFGFDEERNIMVVDALGTLDESRFTFRGIPVSKEIARTFYRRTTWFEEVSHAKKSGKIEWREVVRSSPPPLPEDLINSISLVYRAYANELTGRKWFDVPPLAEVLNKLEEVLME